MKILDEIRRIGVVPVVALNDAKDAEALAKALCEGGLPCAEVTFRTDAAEEAIRTMTGAYPEMLVGAGTVMTPEQAERAVKAGARFIVTPGLNEPVLQYCLANEVPIVPGVMDTYAIEKAIAAGLDTVKFFPAGAAGGLKMLREFAGPYRNLRYMPTGGIDQSNVKDYLTYEKVVAVGGTWIAKSGMIDEGRFDEIRELAEDAVQKRIEARGE